MGRIHKLRCWRHRAEWQHRLPLRDRSHLTGHLCHHQLDCPEPSQPVVLLLRHERPPRRVKIRCGSSCWQMVAIPDPAQRNGKILGERRVGTLPGFHRGFASGTQMAKAKLLRRASHHRQLCLDHAGRGGRMGFQHLRHMDGHRANPARSLGCLFRWAHRGHWHAKRHGSERLPSISWLEQWRPHLCRRWAIDEQLRHARSRHHRHRHAHLHLRCWIKRPDRLPRHLPGEPHEDGDREGICRGSRPQHYFQRHGIRTLRI